MPTLSLTSPVIGLAFYGLNPPTATVGVDYDAIMFGSGFLAFGINALVADDGLGHEYNCSASTDSDSTVSFEFNSSELTPPGVFALYYSNDGGATRFPTGLNILSQ